jgi:putative DNA primase/helicase
MTTRKKKVGSRRKQRRQPGKKAALEQGSSLPPTSPTEPEAADEHQGPQFWVMNDIDNGRLFAKLHHEQVKYIETWERWFEWTGSVWSEDRNATARLLAQKTAKLIESEARKSTSKDFAKHAKHSCSRAGVEAMLKLAEDDGRVRMRSDRFDTDPWLLNVANGTIDLRTGTRRGHRPEDYITKIVEVEYDADAPRNQWDEFLEEMVPDPSVRDYLQRAVGYTLTGKTEEQKFFLLYGRGASGKGTFIEAIDGIMGSYATVANFRIFLESQEKRFDMWRHAHSRMVSAQEVREGQRFDEGTLKLMVGGDVQTAERKYCDQFQFTPHWTVWLGANARPHIDADDDAMWRRVRIIPFTNSLPEERRDPRVRATLSSDAEVQQRILAWAVEGTRMWLERPLHVDEPDAVRHAATDYRASSNNFAEFFEDTFDSDPAGFTPSGMIQEKYRDYCATNGEPGINQNQVARHLREMGFVSDRAREGGEPVRGWRGFVPRP